MRKLFFPLFLLLFFKQIPLAQALCDTAQISTALARSYALLDQNQLEAALESATISLQKTAGCEAPAALKAEVLLQTNECYQALAADLLRRGQSNRAIDMAERSVALLRQMPADNAEQLANAYLVLGNAQKFNGNNKISHENLTKGIEIRRANNPLDPKISNYFYQLVNNCFDQNAPQVARQYLDEWEVFHQSLGTKLTPAMRLNAAISWATYYDFLGQPARGAQLLEDSLLRYGAQSGNRGLVVSIAEFNLCELFAQMGNHERSLFYAEKNVASLETRLQQQHGKLFSRSHYAWYLAQSARAAWNLHLQTSDTAYLQQAQRRCEQAEREIQNLRDRAPNDGFRDWIANEVGISANLAEVRYGLYAHTGQRQHLERSFETVETSRMFAVQQFLHEAHALQWGGLPDSVQQREAYFRDAVNELETNFFMVRSQPNADSLLAANDQKLFALRDAYRVFLAGLEKNQPEYFRLKYSHPHVSLRQVQTEILRPGQCMLDLFIENSRVFALVVRPDTLFGVTTPFDSTLEKALEVFGNEPLRYVENQNLPEKEYLAHLQGFADAAHRAYQGLLAPVRPLLSEEVLLIPRDALANLPFGALITQRETNMAKPQLWHFLDRELVLSQAHSAGLFHFVQNRPAVRRPARSTLALAPFFEGEISEDIEIPTGDLSALTRNQIFKPLPNSGAEAIAIARITRGERLVGAAATKASFLEKCADFKILHLATHSAANDVLGEYSFVALQAQTSPQKVEMLYARDIYGLRLSADLVVLSACETALGQYRKDEGIVGLTRAFICAGARNVVASLWSVNDASTKELMVLFYKEIEKGEPYNRALASAKRAFLLGNRTYAHPYFWAGFVLNGR
jgi:CHAT domain-containing protein